MSENLFCENQKTPGLSYDEGWYRTFKGYPEINEPVKELLDGYKDNSEKMFLFFMEYVTNDPAYASFLVSDYIEGIWDGR